MLGTANGRGEMTGVVDLISGFLLLFSFFLFHRLVGCLFGSVAVVGVGHTYYIHAGRGLSDGWWCSVGGEILNLSWVMSRRWEVRVARQHTHRRLGALHHSIRI